MITKEQALTLRYGDIIYHVSNRNADGTPQRWRVNGAVKIWKRKSNAHRFSVPLKYGLYVYDYLDESSAHLLCLTEEEALTN